MNEVGQTREAMSSSGGPAGATVLVVDDDDAIREVFRSALERAGYRVLDGAGAEEARALLAEHDVDVALLDVEMPGHSGIDLANEIRVAAQLRDRSRWLARLDEQLAARSRLASRVAELDPSLPAEDLEDQLLALLSEELPLRTLRIIAPILGGDVDEGLLIETADDRTRVRVALRFSGVLMGVLEATVDGQPERTVSTLGDLAPQLGAVIADNLGRSASTADARRWVAETVAEGGLSAVFQPIVSLSDESAVGFEGLTRFADGTRPDVAFMRASRYGVAPDLEAAAVQRILEDARALPEDAWVSVNVSPATLLSDRLDGLLGATGRQTIVEVTENEHVGDYAAIRARLDRVPGIRLAVDDAGAGYASLRHVFELRPDLVKLDRSWVADIDADPVRQALVRGLIGFSAAFDARIVAEGLERREEADTLRELGVPLAQGFLFGRPAPVGAAGGGPGPAVPP